MREMRKMYKGTASYYALVWRSQQKKKLSLICTLTGVSTDQLSHTVWEL